MAEGCGCKEVTQCLGPGGVIARNGGMDSRECKYPALLAENERLRGERDHNAYLHQLELGRAQKAEGEHWQKLLQLSAMRRELAAAHRRIEGLANELKMARNYIHRAHSKMQEHCEEPTCVAIEQALAAEGGSQ